jgi:hypothetical protein
VPDVRRPGSRKYALMAFIMCLVWMGVISYFMVEFAEIIGGRFLFELSLIVYLFDCVFICMSIYLYLYLFVCVFIC